MPLRVRIHGENLDHVQQVLFDGVPVVQLEQGRDEFGNLVSTHVDCTPPAHEDGTVDVTVITAMGQAVLEDAYQYGDLPDDPVEAFGAYAAWRGDSVEEGVIQDISGNGRDLTINGTGISTGTTSTGNGWGVDGVPVITSTGFASRYAEAADEEDWKFLHDGSGFRLYAVLRPTATATTQLLFDTGATGSSANTGISFSFDGTRERFGLAFANGAGAGLIPWLLGPLWSWNDTVALSQPHLLMLSVDPETLPNVQVWLDGELIYAWSFGDRDRTAGEGPALSTGDPTNVFRLFANVSGNQMWTGELGECVIFEGGAWSPSEQAHVRAWAQSRYGIEMASTRGLIVWDGNSLVDNIWRANQFAELVTPELTHESRNFMRAISGKTGQQLLDRSEKHVYPCLDTSAPFLVVAVNEVVNSYRTGSSKEESYADLAAYCLDMKAHGAKVVVALPPPCLDVDPEDMAWIWAEILANAETIADAVVRTDQQEILGSWEEWETDYGDNSGPKTYWSDGIHLTAAGNALWAPLWADAINSVLPEEE